MQRGHMNERILLVDPAADAEAAAAHLAATGYVVDAVDDGYAALQSAERNHPHLAIVDLGLTGEATGIETATSLRRREIAVVFVVDTDDETVLASADQVKPSGYLARPIDDRQLRLTVRAALAPGRRATQRSGARKQALGQLHKLQSTHDIMLSESIFDNVSEGIVVTDMEGKLLYANHKVTDFLSIGESSQPLAWLSRFEYFYPDEKTPFPPAEILEQLRRQLESGGSIDIYFRGPGAADGYHLSLSSRPIKDMSGQTIGGVTLMRDTTETMRANAKLRTSVAKSHQQNELIETVFDSISDGLIVIDEQGNYLVFNRSAKNIIGKYVPDAALGERSNIYGMFRSDQTTVYPIDELPTMKSLRGESTDGVEIFVRNEARPDGVYISVNGRPLRDGSGSVYGGTIVFRDITEQKKAREAIDEANRRLHHQTQTMDAVFEGIGDGVLVFDMEGKLILNNNSADRMVGKGMLARSDPTRWRPGHGVFYTDQTTRVPQPELPHMRAIRGISTEDMQVFIRNPLIPNGVHLSLDARPMYDRARRLSGAVLVARDVTAHHQAHQALSDAFAHGRLEVLDTIVHNVGNAINSVAVGVSTLREQIEDKVLVRRLAAVAKAVDAHRDDWPSYVASDRQGKQVLPFVLALAKDLDRHNDALVQTIERVAARVTHIVEIVRNQTSTYNGAVARVEVDLAASINGAAGILRESLEKRDITLSIDCRQAPRDVRVQESSFNQLIVNLIKNAIDAVAERQRAQVDAPPPYIRIKAFKEGELLVIDVTDNGIGIDPADFRSIFFPGYTTKVEGTGLGLHSAAIYVISSGGTIQPSSQGIGHGTTMRVAWPIMTVVPNRRKRT